MQHITYIYVYENELFSYLLSEKKYVCMNEFHKLGQFIRLEKGKKTAYFS